MQRGLCMDLNDRPLRPQVYSVESADGEVLRAKALPVPILGAPAHARAAPADSGAGARLEAATASRGQDGAARGSLSVVSVAVVPPDVNRGMAPPR